MTSVEHARDSAQPNPKPAYAQPRLILYVLLGGAIGTAGREGLSLAMPSDGGVPWAVLIVNLLGAFILGFLLTALAARKPETPGRRDLRLFAGTGMMGGFTTYSSLATDTATLYETHAGIATAYGLGSVIGGILTAFLGVLLGGALSRPASTGRAAA
ncbi:fluoride efflux transporter FluC [Microbacterium caowuchunii]|uniref:Fluoride-specific ion channel FluC n=1 Tax=Microbacterium caowuchunii TaxID=2614638 RepID=A0A5N0T531_9MICO|nr:CrcB family protein [Microbacterium caowuchunii]KAA9129962.1 CrcB family protein [Microbacterium caowuchunii]